MKKVSIFGSIIGGKFSFANGAEAKWGDVFSQDLIDGDLVKITVEKTTPRNMIIEQQRRYYRGIIIKILGSECGYKNDDMHKVLGKQFLSYEVTGRAGITHTLVRSTKNGDMDTKEFTVYLEKCLATAHQLNLRIPTPEEIEENPYILNELYPKIFPLTGRQVKNLLIDITK